MDTLFWVLAVVGVLAVAAVAAWVVSRSMHRRRLRDRFGSEYERTVERTGGDRKKAESVLGERLSRRKQIELRDLSPEARETFLRRWEQVQAEFVDQPEAAVDQAQALLEEVMVARGYPAGDGVDERADLISVDHPDAVEHYRSAQRLHRNSGDGDATTMTEDRRLALVQYRTLFADLLDTATSNGGSGSAKAGDGSDGNSKRRTADERA